MPGRPRPRATVAAALTALALACGGAALAPADSPSDLNWTAILPADPGASGPRPKAVRGCRRATLRCVVVEARRLAALRRRLRCDHRGVFATTYLELTREVLATVRRRPGHFRYPRYLFREDALFANVYFRAVRAWHHGRRVPPAWRIAFEAARDRDLGGAQDMLLGINAHVQNDMPFVLAALGLRTEKGRSRKPDHDAMNPVLDRAYERVVRAVERRYDPFVSVTNSPLTPLDDTAGIELVREWRERVWRNAERLVGAKTRAERRQVAADIQEYAARWARSIASFEMPGHRGKRDAYCRSRLGS